MEAHDDDFANSAGDVPWGKYTYALEGLASGCYLEGAVNVDLEKRPGAPRGKRLRFRVELPERCFILSIAIKLPNAPTPALKALDDVCIERTLRSADYEMIHDGVLSPSNADRSKRNSENTSKKTESDEAESPGMKRDDNAESPVAVDATAGNEQGQVLKRKKVLEIRRAADSLRITLADIDKEESLSSDHRTSSSNKVSDFEPESLDGGGMRKLGVAVVGYIRGQTPVASRIKTLLNSSSRLGAHGALADRAEVDGLLGLAFLGTKKFRQAAELLQRASNTTKQVAINDAKKGFGGDLGFSWAAELNLLAAHAYFEHEPLSNDGVSRLIAVIQSPRARGSTSFVKEFRDVTLEFHDVRTDLLRILPDLMDKLVRFLNDSKSLAVQMASASMIEFVGEQLGCGIAPHMARILDRVLRAYPHCKTLGARERAAAASFSYDSMEDCYERLVDFCCKLLPLTERSVLQRILDQTLIPVFHDAFDENEYLIDSENAEDEADELLSAAVSQTLRLIYLVVSVLGGDAHIPPSFIKKILDILVLKNGNPRTAMLPRRAALHTWDALSTSVIQSSDKLSVKEFKEYLAVFISFLPKLISKTDRPDFDYGESDNEEEENSLTRRPSEKERSAQDNQFHELLLTCKERTYIVDRHTLKRLLRLIVETCTVLEPFTEEDERHTAAQAVMEVQSVLGQCIADLFMSALIDVSYHAAITSGNGPESNSEFFEFGDLNSQLIVTCDALEGLMECYWGCLRLLPPRLAEEAEKAFALRKVLEWCVHKMKQSAPPRGMLRLLVCVVRGLRNKTSTTFMHVPEDNEPPPEASFLSILRVTNVWLSRTSFAEALDLQDILCEAVAEDLMASDIVSLIEALGSQVDDMLPRVRGSVAIFSSIVAKTTPRKPDAMKKSLKDLTDPALDKQRIVNNFPKAASTSSGRFGGNSFTRKIRFAAAPVESDPMSCSLYLHVILASCFDKFDSLGRAAKRNFGPSYMMELLDAFIEHSALLVRCLHACGKERKHREYIAATLGDIFGTCLAMQDHVDGRVRLAGFEIFSASLDVLFLAEASSSSSSEDVNASEGGVVGTLQRRSSSSNLAVNGTDSTGIVKELNPAGERDEARQLAILDDNEKEPIDSSYSVSNDIDDDLGDATGASRYSQLDEELREKFEDGGTCVFQQDSASPSDLNFEERGWQTLCAFMTSSLGIGKHDDFVVQRSCLGYIRNSILNALRGRSSGASIISFEHVQQIWDAVMRLVGSPSRALNSLAFWVICSAVNVAVYSAVMAKGRAAKNRAAQLEEFAANHLFPTIENFLKGGNKEVRLWGTRLLEVYLRARDLNINSLDICPAPPRKILMALRNLAEDWCREVRTLAKTLLDIHFESFNKKTSSSSTSLTDKAQSLLYMKRLGYQDDGGDGVSGQGKIELWFPPLPKSMPSAELEKFSRSLEAFANTEIEGGEEVELEQAGESHDEYDEDEYDEENEGYYEEEEEEQEAVEDDEEQAEGEVESEDPTSPMETSKEKVEIFSDDGNEVDSVDEAKQSEEASADGSDEFDDDEFTDLSPSSRQKKENPFSSKQPKEDSAKEEKEEEDEEIDLDDFGGIVIQDEEEEVVRVSTDLDTSRKNSDGDGRSPSVESVKKPFSVADIDLEKMPTLRRVGSFTGRPPQTLSAEGEAPRLARRRSVDVVMNPELKSLSRGSSFSRRRSHDRDDDVNQAPPVSPTNAKRRGLREVPSLALGESESGHSPTPPTDSTSPTHSKSGLKSPRESASSFASSSLSSAGHRSSRTSRTGRSDEENTSDDSLGSSSSLYRRTSPTEESRHRLEQPSLRSRRSLPRASAFIKGGPPRVGSSQRMSRSQSSSRGLRGDELEERVERIDRLERPERPERLAQRFGKRDLVLDPELQKAGIEESRVSPKSSDDSYKYGTPKSDPFAARLFAADAAAARRRAAMAVHKRTERDSEKKSGMDEESE